MPMRGIFDGAWPRLNRGAASMPMAPAKRTLRRVITVHLVAREVPPSYAYNAKLALPTTGCLWPIVAVHTRTRADVFRHRPSGQISVTTHEPASPTLRNLAPALLQPVRGQHGGIARAQ